MNDYLHPLSAVPIRGMRLAPGALLSGSDYYDSTDGKWRLCPCPGATIRDGCATVFARPCIELSSEAKNLPVYLAAWNFCLTERWFNNTAQSRRPLRTREAAFTFYIFEILFIFFQKKKPPGRRAAAV